MRCMCRAVFLTCSIFLIGCAGNTPVKYANNLPMNNKISVGEVAVYEGLKKNEKTNINDPYYAEVISSYLENMEKNLKDNGFSVESAECTDCLVLKTKLNNKKPLLGGALGIMGLGAIRARVEVYNKNTLVYSHAVEVVTDIFFGPAVQIRRGIAPMLVKQLRKDFHPKREIK